MRKLSSASKGRWLWAVSCLLITNALAQNTPLEHVFQAPQAAVDKALRDLHISAPGRLPTLDGFVRAETPMLEKYERGYYQYKVELHQANSGATALRVAVKVTAWYPGGGGTPPGYRELPSNGRLEDDLIERLEESLQQAKVGGRDGAKPAPPTTSPVIATDRAPLAGKPADTSVFHAPLRLDSPANRFEVEAPSTQQLAQEKRVQLLTEQTANLEEALRNQSRPADLAAVVHAGTPVLAKPAENSDLLFKADAEDEFKVLDESDGWVHVQVSGISRGWIRRTQLEMPGEQSPSSEAATKSPAPGVAPEVHEETSLFPGDWAPLRGRMVRIRWVQSESGTDTSGKTDHWPMLRSVFRDTYARVLRSSIKIEGVVVVIDAADGGMVAATTDVLQRWTTGMLSDAAFRKACWADPPEALGETAQSESK